MDNKHRISIKKVTTIIIVVQALVFFLLACVFTTANEFKRTKKQTDYALNEVRAIIPELAENEEYTTERYERFVRSRCIHLARRINEGWVMNEEEFERSANFLELSDAYVTDKEGNILMSYGEKAHVDLPYEEGELLNDNDVGSFYYSGFSDELEYITYGIPLEDEQFLTVEVATEDFNTFLSDTFSFNEQLRVLGACCNVDVFAFSASDGTIVSSEDTKDYGARIKKTDFANTGISVFHVASGDVPFYIGSSFTVEDVIIAAAVPLLDVFLTGVAFALQLTVVVTLAVSLIGWFVYGCAEKGVVSKREFSQNLVVISVISLVLTFAFSWFWQVLSKEVGAYTDLRKLLTQNAKAQGVYETETGEIDLWMDDQYLLQCRIAAETITDHYYTLTTEELKDLSEMLDVEFTYVVDKNGETFITDSPYNHFVFRKDGDQSAAFRPLLDGVDQVVQEPMEDDVSGEFRQYIGVSIRDENGDPDGCVLISLDEDQISSMRDMISLERTLHYGLSGDTDKVFILDGEDLSVLVSTDGEIQGMDAADFGLTKEALDAEQVSRIQYNGTSVLAGSYKMDGLLKNGGYLVMCNYPARPVGAVGTALLISAYVLLILLVFGGLGKKYVQELPPEEEGSEEKKNNYEESAPNMFEDERGFFVFSKLAKTNEKTQFEERWNMRPKKPEEMTAGELTFKSLRRYALLICVVFLLPLVFHFLGFETPFSRVLGYVADGNWEKGIIIFTVAQCILLIVVMVLLNAIIKKVLYYIARISPARVETVCLLIRSSMKYIFAIIVLFYVLLKCGINPTTLLASAGVLSVVIGFGAQHIMADILAGFFIIFERAFDVGDYIRIDNTYGMVTEIGLRTTKISWYADVTVINNSEIKKVINETGGVMRMIVPVRVRYEEKLEELEKKIEDALPGIGSRMNGVVKPPAYLGVEKFADNGFDLQFVLYADGYKRMVAQRQFLREIKLFLEKNNIETPYEQVIIHEK